MTRPRATTSHADALGAAIADMKARLAALELLAHTPCSGVLQLVSVTMTDTQTISATNTWTTVTNCQATIVPKSAASKVYLSASLSYGGANNAYGAARFVRGSTAIAIGDAASTRERVTSPLNTDNDGASGAAKLHSASMSFLDSPATTSPVTYAIQVWNDAATGGPVYINRTGGDLTNSFYFRGVSTLTVMEVAG